MSAPPRILYVEDYPDDAALAAAALLRDGVQHEAVVVETMQDAAALVLRESFSAVIADYNLGSGSGLELLRLIRGAGLTVPFIILSGTIGEERAVETIREGANDYVMKDRIGRLVSVIRRELAAAEARAAQALLEERLRRAEERYRRTFEEAPIGIATVGPDGKLISVNHQLCRLLGYSEQELIGRPYLDLIDPEERAEVQQRMQAALAGGELQLRGLTRRYRRKDGTGMWGKVTVSMLRDAAGATDCFVACIEDITGERAAREKVLLQARLLECVEQAVIATDVAGTINYWNAAAERLYGWSVSEAAGRRIVDLMPAAETEDRVAEIIETLRRGGTFTGQIALRRRDGTAFPAYVTNAPIFDDRGAMIGMVGVSYDLTEQKRAESELREHKLQLAEAQEIASVGSWTYDFATGARTWSDALVRLLGAEPGTAMTVDDVMARIHPDDRARVLAAQQRLHETLEPASIDFRVCTDTGTRVFALRARVELNPAGEPLRVVGVMQDVSEIKGIEEELRRRTVQQTAVANLGQLALSGALAQVVLDQAAFLARTLLEGDFAEVLQCVEDRFTLAAGDGWEEGDVGFTKPPEHCQATFAIEINAPVVVEDVAAETRFSQSVMLASRGIVSGVMVVINTADGMPWGVLGVHSTVPRTFADYDVEFLRSMASVLGQTIARGQADAELRQRARQQSAIASFGRLVLNSVDSLVLDRVAEILVDAIDADFGCIVELVPGGTLRRVAGRVWTELLPDELPVEPNTQVGYTVLTGEPVIVDDYRTDTRFDSFEKTVPFGILSGAMVPVTSARRTFGVLAAQSRRAGHFRIEHIDFLQALANILSEALEREQARLEIEESELRYRRIFDGATEIIFTVDIEGRFVRLNPAFTAITGWTCEEWIGRPYEELLVPEDRERTRRMFEGILAVGNGTSTETTLLGRDRAVIIDVQSFPKIENGVVTEVYGFARDVTDARLAAAGRERVTRNLELILESTIEGIYTIDPEGNCTMINRAAAAFIGAPPEELLGSPMHELLHTRNADGSHREPDDCPILGVLRGGEPVSVSKDVFCRLDGTAVPVAYSAAAIVDGGRLLGAVVTFTDLTERRQLEAKLEQATRLSSLGRLAATVAHEFNNVLMGIAPFVQIIERASSREKITFALEHISTSVKRGRRVTEDILRFTQPGEPSLAFVGVEAWLESVAAEGRQMIGPRYSLTVESGSLSIEGDASQLHQIFMNLILNARDAMPAGGSIHVAAREERSDARFAFGAVSDPARYVHFTVTDTGCGMSEETLRHAFEPLFTTKKKGTGLGLAVTHQVVQRHGGEIFIESEPGKGTTFHVFIPRATRAAAVIADDAADLPNTAQSRLLLVEDDPAVAAGLTALLECEGFDVSVAGTGGEALELIRRGRPDAVILDVGLPDMDGRTVFAGIARLYPRLPIVFSTGHSDRSQLEEFVSRPHVGYLMKPYDGAALIEELTRTMAGEG